MRIFSDSATSSRTPALARPGFRELAGYARGGDTLTVSELYRLCRDLADILAVRDWCQQHRVRLCVLSGALSGISDLAGADATTTLLAYTSGTAQRLEVSTSDLGQDRAFRR